MKMSLDDYLSEIARAAVLGAFGGTKEAVSIAERAHDELAIDAPIGGVDIHVEGAANMPADIMMQRAVKVTTEATLEQGADGLDVVLKRSRLFGALPRLEVEIEFERRNGPLESLERLRDRALEVLGDQIKLHRAKVQLIIDEGENGSANQPATD